MDIGIDLDGVCYDFGGACERYAASLGLGHVLPSPRVFSFYKGWGMTSEAFWAWTAQGVDAGQIFTGPAMEGAPEALRALFRAGHRLHIKTHRAQGTKSEVNTRAWLLEHKIPYTTLTFTADKTSGPYCETFVEDQLGNYDALDAFGVKAFLIDRDWNQDPGDARRRVGSITEFANLWLPEPLTE